MPHRFAPLALAGLLALSMVATPAGQLTTKLSPALDTNRLQVEPLLVVEEVFTATIDRVDDGDTVLITERRIPTRFQMDGVDAPEFSQPFGPESQVFLNTLVFGRQVSVHIRTGASANGVRIARLYVNGADVSLELIRNGMAWSCRQHQGVRRALVRAELEAREAKRGLWSTAEPTPPWQYRGVADCGREK
jgi:endonuclease YncB( thermonuclease family)